MLVVEHDAVLAASTTSRRACCRCSGSGRSAARCAACSCVTTRPTCRRCRAP